MDQHPQPLSSTRRVLQYVTGVLLAEQGRRGANPLHGIDVERVMSALELLADRRTLELSPFVAAWDPSVESFDRVELGHFEADRSVDSIFRAALSGSGLGSGRELVSLIERVARGTGDGRVYRSALQSSIRSLVDVLASHGPTDYLQPIFDAADPSDGVLVATLNYDTTVEDHGAGTSQAVCTGIESWSVEGQWDWGIGRRVVLMKLHGSIDWEQTRREGASVPETLVRRTDGHGGGDPALIFGGANKLRADGPFLELLAQWEQHLRNRDNLIAIGYSFRDPHINHVIRRWVNRHPDAKVAIVDPRVESITQTGFGRELARALVPRITFHPNRRDDAGRLQMSSESTRLISIALTASDGLILAAKSMQPENAFVWDELEADPGRGAAAQINERLARMS